MIQLMISSERGVVFFRDAEITEAEQKVLVQALGVHGGKPASSGLHVHPLTLVDGGKDEEISVISNKYVHFSASARQRACGDQTSWALWQPGTGMDGRALSMLIDRFVFHNKFAREDRTILDRGDQKLLWHSDITFENVPSDYASLQIRQLPEGGGGDTLWASAYEAYDRLSPAYQRFLEGLTATHQGTGFLEIAKRNEQIIRDKRGSPENNTQDLLAVHPVIRTNPVTGWKGLFVNRGFTKKVNELTKPESDALLEYLFNHISGVSTTLGERGPRLTLRITICKCASAGRRIALPFGITGQPSVSASPSSATPLTHRCRDSRCGRQPARGVPLGQSRREAVP